MLFEETRQVRAFVGQIDAGDDVVEALMLLCDANDLESASVRATGSLEDVELVKFDRAQRQYVTTVEHDGPWDIVSLQGSAATVGGQVVLRVDVLLACDGPAGQQLVFGQLRRGRAVDCEFAVVTYPDLRIERKLDPVSGRFPIAGIESVAAPAVPVAPPPSAAPVPPRERKEPETVAEPAGTAAPAGAQKSSMSWADAMEASGDIKPARERVPPAPQRTSQPTPAEAIYADLDYDEVLVKAGDILDHPKLGECRVIKVEDDEYAHIRLSRGQIRKLALELITLEHVGERDGKNLFKVRIRK